MPSHPPAVLTDAFIRGITPPTEGRDVYPDRQTSGLRLRVGTRGKAWWLSYRVRGALAPLKENGKRRPGPVQWLKLGDYPAVSLKDARDRAKAHTATALSGRDPAEVQRLAEQLDIEAQRQQLADIERAKREDAARVTVAQLAPRWLKLHIVAKSTHDGYRMALDNHIVPALGAMKVADVERRHVVALHATMQETPAQANRTLAVLSLLMSFAETEGARAEHTNPVHRIKKYVLPKRQRFLTHEELTRLGAILTQAEREGLPPSPAMQAKKSGMSLKRRAKVGTRPKRGPRVPTTAEKGEKGVKPIVADRYSVAALRLMLLTGWRMAEVVGTRWADVDLQKRVVVHRTTKGGATARPLSAPAAALLEDLPRAKDSPWVFPRAADSKLPAGKPRRLWDAVRHAAGLDADDKAIRVMPHDLRHSVGAVAASSGASLPVIAALLGHKQVSTTERYSHLSRDARHVAADTVGETIAGLLDKGAESVPSADVIPIDKRRRRRA